MPSDSTNSDNPGRRRRSRGSYRDYLARRRDEAHAAAQSEAEAHPPIEAPDHPLVPSGPVQLISEPHALAGLLERLRSAGRFAYDTEFIGETSYVPKLCLVQVATASEVAVIDPLTGPELDLTGLWELLADRSVEKVVHAGEPDLEPVVRALDRGPANVFDTQTAAAFAGLPYPAGLNRLIAETVGVELPKALTFTKWDVRPLSTVHLEYAANDVRYLLACRTELIERVESRRRCDWLAEELTYLEDPARYQFDAETMVGRFLKNRSLGRRSRLVLRRLVTFRDRRARRRNLPPRSILKDEVLVELARERPGSVRELREVPGLPRRLIQQEGEQLVQLIERARESQAYRTAPERRSAPTASQRKRVDELFQQVKQLCEAHDLPTPFVASRRDFATLAMALIRRRPLPKAHPLLTGWRRELLAPVLDPVMAAHEPA